MSSKTKLTLLVFFLTLFFYTYSLLPSLAWGDGVKLQSEVVSGESFVISEMPPEEFVPDPYPFSKVGVAAWDHPLYTVLGHLLIEAFPFADPLWLVNFVSALFGAASVALVFRIARQITDSLPASLYAAFSLAVSHTFWWHSSTPEVYTLFVFLLMAAFHFHAGFEEKKKPSYLFASGLFLGLAASTHILGFLAFPAIGLYYFLSGGYRNFNPRGITNLIPPALGFAAGFALYILQFIRMSANFPLAEIMGPVVGSAFFDQLEPLTLASLGKSIVTYLLFLIVQFGPVGLVLGVIGFRQSYPHTNLAIRKSIAFFIVYATFGIYYRVSDQFTFFITSYIFWALMMGIGASHLLASLPARTHRIATGVLGAFLLVTPFFYTALPHLAESAGVDDEAIGIPQIGTGLRNGLAYYLNPFKRGDTNAYDFGYQTTMSLEPNSVVIAEWYTDTDEYFILRYFTKIRPLREDVKVIGWHDIPPASFDPQVVSDLIERTLPESPVYIASLSERFYNAPKLVETYCIVPENNLYRVYPKGNEGLQCLGNKSVTQ
ncbi:MAG: hypothetical protein DPW18_15470 [Chloroflexi bacterium]|nr:hypothetical protein [Chloroflexota bacterium]MDL1943553.1 DUF2723 domain-containing protein [Chloroflexi bacterium CFX2]